jgi:hypothetical protein
MIKLGIFAVVALLLGVGGGAGVRVLTAPPLPPGADSLIAAADTAKAHAAPHGAPHGAAAGAAPHAAADAAHGAAADAHAVPGVAADAHATPAPTEAAHASPPATPAAAGGHADAAHAGPEPEAYKQVGSILLAMKPAEAARIIAYLSDAQVHGLLQAMGPRQAAQVMAQLPPERGAAISRRLLAEPREAH